jgi:ferredoxin
MSSMHRRQWSVDPLWKDVYMASALMVWIDQDLCTGDGICSEICPDVFVGRDDGLWVVKEEASHFGTTIVFDGADGPGHGPDSGRGVARIPDSLIDLAVDAAEECPGECIMIEPFDQTAISNRGV